MKTEGEVVVMMNEARNRANKKYLMKLDDIIFRVQRGRKDKIKARAESLGMSLNAYLIHLIENDMGPLD